MNSMVMKASKNVTEQTINIVNTFLYHQRWLQILWPGERHGWREVWNVEVSWIRVQGGIQHRHRFEEFARSFDEEIAVVCVWWGGDSYDSVMQDLETDWWRRGRRRGGWGNCHRSTRPYFRRRQWSFRSVNENIYSGINHKARLCIGITETPRS